MALPKKAKRSQRKKKKWSRANLLNYIAGAVLAISMLLGSVFVFGGTPSNPAQLTPTVTLELTVVAPTAVTTSTAASTAVVQPTTSGTVTPNQTATPTGSASPTP